MSSDTGRLDRYKLDSEITEHGVTHRTIRSDLDMRRRRIQVLTTWVHEKKLGAGAFGEVSLQRESGSGKLRAVKAIAKSQLRTSEMEALIDLQDHCDLFVAFLGWYECLGVVHIAMEYIAHGDLGQYIADHPVETREAQEIAFQILEGLVVLHKREICHRDLKPQNILMASLSPLWVKITDFGISKRWAGTALHTHCGTPLYQAPELIGLLPRHMKTGQIYTWSVDIWALGAIVHQVLTSEIPFLESDLPSEDSTYESMGVSIDGELLLNYCAGRSPFPSASLITHGASTDAVDFVKSLMLPDPTNRVTAVSALKSVWLSDIASRGLSELSTHGPPQMNFTKPANLGTHVGGEVPERASPSQPLPAFNIITPNPVNPSFTTAVHPSDIVLTRLKETPQAARRAKGYPLSTTPQSGIIENPFANPRQPPPRPPPARVNSTDPAPRPPRATASTSMRPPPRNSRSGPMVPIICPPSSSDHYRGKSDPLLILVMGGRGGGQSLFADLFSTEGMPDGFAGSLRVSWPFVEGIWTVQLIVGPDSYDDPLNYHKKIRSCMSTFPDREISGIIYLNTTAQHKLDPTVIEYVIKSIAGLCVPYFHRRMLIWANTTLTGTRWWESGTPQIAAISQRMGGTHPSRVGIGIGIVCLDFITQIVNEHSRNNQIEPASRYLRSLNIQNIINQSVEPTAQPLPS